MENEKEKDFLLEEISDYYSQEPDFTEEEMKLSAENEIEFEPSVQPASPPVQKTPEENADIKEEEEREELDEAFDEEAAPNDKMFYILTAAIAFSVLLSVFLVGILRYKSEEDVNFRFSHIQTSSNKYSNAQERINLVNEEISALEDELTETQSELNTLTEYESNTGVIKSKQNVLKDELDTLNDTAKKKEQALSDIENSIKKKLPTMVTLTPGLYTVGENIFSGNYSAVGEGAILISSSTGSAIVNTTLTSEAVSFTLNNGDIVKLGTKAVFNRINKEQ